MIPPPQQFRFRDPVRAEDLNRAQDGLLPTVSALSGVQISDGVLLEEVVLASGANIVPHKLGRILQGWIPVRVRASATLYDTQDANNTPDQTLLLTASALVTVDLWVF